MKNSNSVVKSQPQFTNKNHSIHSIPACTWWEKIKIHCFCMLFNFTWIYKVSSDGFVEQNYLIQNSYPDQYEYLKFRKYYIRKTPQLEFYAENQNGDRILEISDQGFDELLTKQVKRDLCSRFHIRKWSIESIRKVLPAFELQFNIDRLFSNFEVDDDMINDGEVMSLNGTI